MNTMENIWAKYMANSSKVCNIGAWKVMRFKLPAYYCMAPLNICRLSYNSVFLQLLFAYYVYWNNVLCEQAT